LPPVHPGRLHHLALRSAEPERSARFYADVIGLRDVRRAAAPDGSVRAIWLALDGAVLMIERALKVPQGRSEGSGHVLAFAVADLGPWEVHLRACAVDVADRTESTLFVQDPDGHRVGLSVYPLADVLG
jgi:catechol 2,3-dioxygenase-like lactoylglutathione lyase family enzyme